MLSVDPAVRYQMLLVSDIILALTFTLISSYFLIFFILLFFYLYHQLKKIKENPTYIAWKRFLDLESLRPSDLPFWCFQQINKDGNSNAI